MTLWLTKLLLAHLITDFLLQKSSWITQRRKKHFAAGTLYLHTLITALLAWALIGWQYWGIAIIIFVSHTIIDGIKSYLPDQPRYFLFDQALHLLVIACCGWFTFYSGASFVEAWKQLQENSQFWIYLTAFVLVSWPSSYLVGQLTKKWRSKLPDSDGLADAGKWIGILERTMIVALVILEQYELVGLLIAAKGIIRFSESHRTEQKTEYLVIGTLISMFVAMATGLLVTYLTVTLH